MIGILPIRTFSEMNTRQCWQARGRRAKQHRGLAKMAVGGWLVSKPVKLPCFVTMIRLAPSNGLDDDNLRMSLKFLRDGIADALRVDDRDGRVSWFYEQRREKTWGVEIRIEAA